MSSIEKSRDYSAWWESNGQLKGVIREGKGLYDVVVRQLRIPYSPVLEKAIKASDSLKLRSGDTCVLFWGRMDIYRGKQKIASMIVDERRQTIEKQYAEVKDQLKKLRSEPRPKNTEIKKDSPSKTPVVPPSPPKEKEQKNTGKTYLAELRPEPRPEIIQESSVLSELRPESRPMEEPHHEGLHHEALQEPDPIKDSKDIDLSTIHPEKRPREQDELRQTITPSIYMLAGALSESTSAPVNGDIIIRMIERESGFDPDWESKKAAKWLMGIQNIVFDDMGNSRVGLYQKYFEKIPDSIIEKAPKQAAEVLRYVKSSTSIPAEKMSKAELKKYSENMNSLKRFVKDPYVNHLIGGVYYAYLIDAVEPPNAKIIARNIENLDIKKLNHLRLSKGKQPVDKDDLKRFANRLKHDETVLRQFYAAASFNGGMDGVTPWTHPYYYATDVMIA